jgi:hypothetical protein
MSIPERLQQALADRYRLEREIGAGGMAFPDTATSRIVLSGNTSEPRWSRNGRERFFKRDGLMTVVPVKTGGELTLGRARNLFPLDRQSGGSTVGPSSLAVRVHEGPAV